MRIEIDSGGLRLVGHLYHPAPSDPSAPSAALTRGLVICHEFPAGPGGSASSGQQLSGVGRSSGRGSRLERPQLQLPRHRRLRGRLLTRRLAARRARRRRSACWRPTGRGRVGRRVLGRRPLAICHAARTTGCAAWPPSARPPTSTTGPPSPSAFSPTAASSAWSGHPGFPSDVSTWSRELSRDQAAGAGRQDPAPPVAHRARRRRSRGQPDTRPSARRRGDRLTRLGHTDRPARVDRRRTRPSSRSPRHCRAAGLARATVARSSTRGRRRRRRRGRCPGRFVAPELPRPGRSPR